MACVIKVAVAVALVVLPNGNAVLEQTDAVHFLQTSHDVVPAEMAQIFNWHNFVRCMHGAPQMTWDAAIAKNALEWAAKGKFDYSPDSDRTLAGMGVLGENIAWGWPTSTGEATVKEWYNQIKFTDGTPTSCDDSTKDGEHICHYTQVVWKASTKFGCGKGRAKEVFPERTYEGDFWVCHYWPAGNVGSFTDNVLAPQKTAAECSSATPPPVPTLPPPPGSCRDGARNDIPTITDDHGVLMSCADLGAFCPADNAVRMKCKKTCGVC
mmetsp:Transcript_45514/g.90156  ORF Transcript_45514/g.90156 Transcript_45514/m.90156 type:complete len:267 (-) Transcript_45514:64-864(-)